MKRLLLLVVILAPALSWALPNQIMQEGSMDREGTLLEGAHDIRVRLYDEEDAQLPFYDERHADVEFLEGLRDCHRFHRPIGPSDFHARQCLGGITIDNQAERSAHRLLKVPAAFTASLAEDVRGDITPSSVSIQGVGVVINDQGEWVGPNVGLRGERGPADRKGRLDQPGLLVT